ncbi:MAG: hypothetical protein ACLQVI_17205 [Polyangiaceae bacterium]
MAAIDEIVERWCARDRGLAFLPGDKAAIEATREPRALVVEIGRERRPHADLFHACAVLGRLIAESGGSPSLASSILDTAREALPDLDAETARAARGALCEGFVAARAEIALAIAAARWEFPGCVVPLESASVAIAAGYPEDDEDALAAWAARVASAVARAGYRRAIVAGGDKARAQLLDALELAGVKVTTTSPPAPVGHGG